MAKYRVMMTTTASQWVEVEVPDDLEDMTPADYAADHAEPALTLCWHCSSVAELGDWELADGSLDEIVTKIE